MVLVYSSNDAADYEPYGEEGVVHAILITSHCISDGHGWMLVSYNHTSHI